MRALDLKNPRPEGRAPHFCLLPFAFCLPGASCAGPRRGFTLIEVLVVLVVVSILLGYMVLSPVSACRRCRDAGRNLALFLELVRDESLLRGREMTVRLAPGRYGVAEAASGGGEGRGADVPPLPVEGETRPSGCRFSLPEGRETLDISFFPQGFATPAVIELDCGGRTLVRLKVDSGGGVSLASP